MVSANILDVILVLLLGGAVVRGLELGFIRQLFSTIGFFGGLLLGAVLEPHIVTLAHSANARAVLAIITTLGLALIFLGVGEIIGYLTKEKLQLLRNLSHLDDSFGAVLAGISFLVVIWLGASALVTLPYPGLQSSIRSSLIISQLNRRLPPAPGIIADIGHLIAPNGFPDVFIGGEPSPPNTTSVPTPGELAVAVKQDQASVVKVEGQGCGGIVEGSGFVVGDSLVATNAHVIAGIRAPYVVDANGTHRATPIWFDPNLDFAVLSVSGLAGTPLSFNTGTLDPGTPSGVLGYPGGGPFTADTAAVIQEFTAEGRNIYNQGNTSRDVYSIQANVMPGNSGGPLIDLQGRVIGVVFAASTTYNNVGYALADHQVVAEINSAQAQNQRVSTGNCAD